MNDAEGLENDTEGSAPVGWVIKTAWILLGLLVTSLLALAVSLVFKMEVFSQKPLGDEQLKSLWAFLGVALGAAATLIGALLTEQNNRRSGLREELARLQQRNQSRETEDRLTLDTRAKVLELLTHEEHYAPQARVAGAIATMMDLRGGGGGAVACRIIDELWRNGKIGTSSAVWLLGRVLQGADFTEEDKAQAAGVLAYHAPKLFPEQNDPDQNWDEWPYVLFRDGWPEDLPEFAKWGLFYMAIKALLSREPDFWTGLEVQPPIRALWYASSSADQNVNAVAAFALTKVLSLRNFIAFSDFVDAEEENRIRSLAETHETARWLLKVYEQFEPWAAGEQFTHIEAGSIPPGMDGARSGTLAPPLAEAVSTGASARAEDVAPVSDPLR